jgi:hypothetical protein
MANASGTVRAMEQTAYLAEDATVAHHRRRWRRFWWTIGLIAVVLLLALTPPLLNVSRFQHRIVSSMSQSLGRPVHLDKVSLHLLPMPGFTLENLVVSEDPAFGDEPIIRANTVEATLRAGSLWKRRVEFSTVTFVEPSVNLVRNASGRWNLESVLVNASRVDTAPTAQAKAGPAPRFPYIEATGGRINVKLGEEKMPFSLTDADFALWLPSPGTWRVRLVGKPARTDSNIGDPGVVRLEGSLERSAHMVDVPINLQASWHDAPLGEASRLLSGDDRGWRGTVHADMALKGTLAAADFRAKITLDDLRRADFVPAQTLDVSVSCTSAADLSAAVMRQIACTVPTSGAQPLLVESPALDMSRPLQSEMEVQTQQLPLEWIFGWMRLFSARVPAEPAVPGTVDAAVTHSAGDPVAQWTGTVSVSMPVVPRSANGRALPEKSAASETAASSQSFDATMLTASNGEWDLTLPPTPVRLGPGAELTLNGQVSPAGYEFALAGQASPAQLGNIAHALPQIGDASGLLVSKNSVAAAVVRPIAMTCSRSWTGGQTCVATQPVKRPKVRRAAARSR